MAYDRVVETEPITVVETQHFVRQAEWLLSENDRLALIGYLARSPMAGVVIPGTGGVRKLRWALVGRGKSGGARVIYFYYNDSLPIFLLDVFAKSEKVDLSQRERNELRSLIRVLVEHYESRRA
jgi:hypothetical protein